ncbi:unnamed protein product [Didymodactylos carnosus]|uniref:DUF6570 domain-containing protein n=1 Tax=Didymodactylos carnosus TaxID=1234261 RepID=A0A813ZVH7_9BILA|nr:unnamed protein product [Didymodactylos carnosus]CAF3685999.1 unnamed protein product [Didymodactylos carnosus]
MFLNQIDRCDRSAFLTEFLSDEKRGELEKCFLVKSISVINEWICREYARQIRRKEVPPRPLAKGLEVCAIPDELKRLNYLEKLLVAMVIPFMYIVDLLPYKQRGTHGPLQCMPANVHETVTALPRSVDKSVIIPLELKRRIQYIAVWKKTFINPAHTRDALECLKNMNDNYKEIEINEVDDNYLANHPVIMASADNGESETIDDRTESAVNDVVDEAMQTDNNNDYNVVDTLTVADDVGERNDDDDSVQENAADGEAGALESGSDNNSDSEIGVEDTDDPRSKFNFSTHSCLQSTNLENYVLDQKIVSLAPAEQNKPLSLLKDLIVEALAFPHIFPDGQGTCNNPREKSLSYSLYYNTRLFSADPRFAEDVTYVFFLQYLNDLKKAYSSVSIALRK